MLGKLSNLGQKLSREELQSINGSYDWVVTCSFSDGGNWQGSTTNGGAVLNMYAHCLSQGGSPSDNHK